MKNSKNTVKSSTTSENENDSTQFMGSITLLGKPRSTSNIYKTMCRGNFPSRYMTTEGRALKEDYQWQAKEQWKVGLITQDIALEIHLYFGDKRLNDWDNFHKISMDALTGIVWKDDSQIKQALVIKDYDKENPRIEIKLSTLQD